MHGFFLPLINGTSILGMVMYISVPSLVPFITDSVLVVAISVTFAVGSTFYIL